MEKLLITILVSKGRYNIMNLSVSKEILNELVFKLEKYIG